jgi:hypothetical protein
MRVAVSSSLHPIRTRHSGAPRRICLGHCNVQPHVQERQWWQALRGLGKRNCMSGRSRTCPHTASERVLSASSLWGSAAAVVPHRLGHCPYCRPLSTRILYVIPDFFLKHPCNSCNIKKEDGWNTWNKHMKYLQKRLKNNWEPLQTYAYSDETLANIRMKHLKTLETYAYNMHVYTTFRSTFATYRQKTCNIRLEQMKHLERSLETCVHNHYNMCNIPISFCNIDIQHLQHNSETSETLKHTFTTCVFSIVLIGGTDLCRGRGSRMKHSRDRRLGSRGN